MREPAEYRAANGVALVAEDEELPPGKARETLLLREMKI